MSQMIFVNLPVSDLPRSRAFYEAIGFTNEPKFSDDTAACMVLSESIFVMLLTHDKWRQFTAKPIPDASATAQVMLCVSRPDRASVDTMVQAAARAGGTPDCNPLQDYRVMYGRSFEDPDGHIWETMWMDATTAEQGADAIADA